MLVKKEGGMMRKFDNKPVPFYFINDTIDKAEVVRQLNLIKQSGVGSIILHARDGITETGYATRKFFSDIKFITEEAAKTGIKVWLYDEDSYPSGNEGGIIAMERPEFVAQELRIKKYISEQDGSVKIKLGSCKAIKAFAVKGDTVTDVSDCFGVERAKWFGKSFSYTYYNGEESGEHMRSATFFPERIFYADDIKAGTVLYICTAARLYCANRFGAVADNTEKACVDKFKTDIYRKYLVTFDNAAYRPEGIFTDEPVSGAFPVWKDDLEKVFFAENNYSFIDNMYKLFDGADEFSARFRADYWRTVSKAFRTNYLKNLKSECHRHGAAFIGHFECEENPYYQILKCTNVYMNSWELDYPGFDSITDKTGSRESPALFAGAKLVSSVSAQRGVKYTLAECMGVNPFNFGIEGMKKIAGWLFIAGANVLVIHGFCYGYSGFRKYDAGKSFFFQDPGFNSFKDFSIFAERYGKKLSCSISTAKTLLVYPDYEFADYVLSDSDKFNEAERKYYSAFNFLTDNHIEFEIADCEYLEKNITTGKIKIGKKVYDSVVFVSAGSPAMKRVRDIIGQSDCYLFVYGEETDYTELFAASVRVKIYDGTLKSIYVNTLLKKTKGGKYLFLYNNGRNAGTVFIESENNAYVYVYSYKINKFLSATVTDGKVCISLAEYSFNMIYFSDKPLKSAGLYKINKEKNFHAEYEQKPDWTYRLPIPVQKYISEYKLSVYRQGKKVLQSNVKWGTLKEHYGADVKKLVPEYPLAVYDNSRIALENYPVRAEYVAEFYKENIKYLLFDKDTFSKGAKVYLNGIFLDIDAAEKTRVYDINNFKLNISDKLINGKNKLSIIFEDAGENDGITGELYLINNI